MLIIKLILTCWTILFFSYMVYEYQHLDKDNRESLQNYLCVASLIWLYLSVPIYIISMGIIIIVDLLYGS